MNCIPVSTYVGLHSLVVIPPLAVFSVHFCSAYRSFSFSCQVVYSYYRFSIFQHFLHVLFAFWRNVVYQAMICRRRQKGRWISIMYKLFQRIFCEVPRDNCLLVKYYIRLLRFFIIFSVNLGFVCVRFNLIRFYIPSILIRCR